MFPKLPVYNRLEQNRVNRNINTRDTTVRLRPKTAALAVELSSKLVPIPPLPEKATPTVSRVVDINTPNPSIDLTIPTTIITAPESILAVFPSPFSGLSPTAFAPQLKYFVATLSIGVLPTYIDGCNGKKRSYVVKGQSKDA